MVSNLINIVNSSKINVSKFNENNHFMGFSSCSSIQEVMTLLESSINEEIAVIKKVGQVTERELVSLSDLNDYLMQRIENL